MRKTKNLVAFLTVVVMVLTFACGLLVACNKSYTITFDANGGKYGSETTITAETEKNGIVATEPTRPTREGYTLTGYNTSKDGKGDKVTFGVDGYKFKKDATVYAQWKVNADPDPDPDEEGFNITLDANGGAFFGGDTQVTLKTNANGTLDSLSKPSRAGDFVYSGYNTEADGTGEDVDTEYVFSEDCTIYAQWKNKNDDPLPPEPIDPVEITLVVGDGTLPEGSPETVMTNEYGRLSEEDLPVPTPNDEKAKFIGWFTSAEGGKEALLTTFTEAASIYAHYEKGFTITLNVGNGVLPEGAQTEFMTVGGVIVDELPIPTSTEDHWDFSGWFMSATGSTLVMENVTVFTADTTIYAQYVRLDGVWLGSGATTFLTELPRNTGNQNEIEYWLGDGQTVELKAGNILSFYINGKLCTDLWITGTGVNNIEGTHANTVTVAVSDLFRIHLKDYSNGAGTDWVVEFRKTTPITVGTSADIPANAAAIVITLGNFDPITIYLVTSAGAAVTETQLSSYSIYTFEAEVFGDWNGASTKGKCATSMSAPADAIPNGWIVRWSGVSMQTGNIEGAIEAGGTYVIKLGANKVVPTIIKIVEAEDAAE